MQRHFRLRFVNLFLFICIALTQAIAGRSEETLQPSGSLSNDPVAPASPTWQKLSPQGLPPPFRFGHSAIYDPGRKQLIIFGGRPCPLQDFNDVWVLSLPSVGTPTWSKLEPSGSPPAPRKENSAIYDPVRDRMLIFGGFHHDAFGGAMLNDVWALDLSGTPTWTQLATSGTPPPPRQSHAAIYDPQRDRMVIFGGRNRQNCTLDDSWSLSLQGIPTWEQIAPSGTRPGARSAPAIYDQINDRMVVFGGVSETCPSYIFYNDTWELPLSGAPAWRQLGTSGIGPVPRATLAAIYDPIGQGMLIFGGRDGSYPFKDTWFLSLADAPTWSSLSPAGPVPTDPTGIIDAAVYDPDADRMLILNRTTTCIAPMETWSLNLGPRPTSIPNRSPIASAGIDRDEECTSMSGTLLVLDGSASTDPDSTPGTNDDIVLYQWFESYGSPSQRSLGTGRTIQTTLPLGPHSISLLVTDHAGATGTATVTIQVVDTTPPIMTVVTDPAILWPPDHRMVPVEAAWQARDACDPAPGVFLASVTSSELDDVPRTGDGITTGDIQDASIGTPDPTVLLRAERSGDGPGRVYTITYTATDALGNTASALGIVTVTHDP